MRRVLSACVLVTAAMAVTLAAAPTASAAGDRFAGMWATVDGSATLVVTPVSEGVYHIVESAFGAACAPGLTEVTDTDAVVVGDVLMVDWVNTACPGDPSIVGMEFPDRTVTPQPDGSLLERNPAGVEATFLRTTTEFFDVAVNRFFTDAVTWLSCEGITTGTTPTTFRPGDPVTRAQMAVFLVRTFELE